MACWRKKDGAVNRTANEYQVGGHFLSPPRFLFYASLSCWRVEERLTCQDWSRGWSAQSSISSCWGWKTGLASSLLASHVTQRDVTWSRDFCHHPEEENNHWVQVGGYLNFSKVLLLNCSNCYKCYLTREGSNIYIETNFLSNLLQLVRVKG